MHAASSTGNNPIQPGSAGGGQAYRRQRPRVVSPRMLEETAANANVPEDFHTLDLDGDGVLQEAEYMAAMNRPVEVQPKRTHVKRRRRTSVIAMVEDQSSPETRSKNPAIDSMVGRVLAFVGEQKKNRSDSKRDSAMRRHQINVARAKGALQKDDLVVRPAVILDVIKRYEDKKTGLILLFCFLLYFFAFILITDIFLKGNRRPGAVFSMQKANQGWIEKVGQANGNIVQDVERMEDVWPWLHDFVDTVYVRKHVGVDAPTLSRAKAVASTVACNGTGMNTNADLRQCDPFFKLYGVDRRSNPRGALSTAHSDAAAVVHGYNRVVHGILIRQRRRKTSDCSDSFEHELPWCVTHDQEDTAAFRGKRSGWTYNRVADLGEHEGSGGYLIGISTHPNSNVSLADNHALLRVLEADEWLDAHTLDATVEVVLYNGNVGAFTLVQVSFELSETGEVIPSSRVSNHLWPMLKQKVHKEVSGLEIAFWGVGGFVVLGTFFQLISEAGELLHLRLDYFLDPYNAVDLASICFMMITIGIWIRYDVSLTQFHPEKVMHGFQPQEEDFHSREIYASISKLTTELESLRSWIGLSMVTSVFRLFKYFRFNRRLRMISKTLGLAIVDLSYFMIIALLVLTGYSYAGTTMYGHENSAFATFSAALHTLCTWTLGEVENDVTSPLFLWSFLLQVYFILTNVFLSIVVDAYVKVKDETNIFSRMLSNAHLDTVLVEDLASCLMPKAEKQGCCHTIKGLMSGRRVHPVAQEAGQEAQNTSAPDEQNHVQHLVEGLTVPLEKCQRLGVLEHEVLLDYDEITYFLRDHMPKPLIDKIFDTFCIELEEAEGLGAAAATEIVEEKEPAATSMDSTHEAQSQRIQMLSPAATRREAAAIVSSSYDGKTKKTKKRVAILSSSERQRSSSKHSSEQALTPGCSSSGAAASTTSASRAQHEATNPRASENEPSPKQTDAPIQTPLQSPQFPGLANRSPGLALELMDTIDGAQ